MELCGHKQATTQAHVRPHCVWLNFEHTKNSNRSKKNPERQKSNSNLLIYSKTPEIVRIIFGAHGIRWLKAVSSTSPHVQMNGSFGSTCCWRCSSCSFPVHVLRAVISLVFLSCFLPHHVLRVDRYTPYGSSCVGACAYGRSPCGRLRAPVFKSYPGSCHVHARAPRAVCKLVPPRRTSCSRLGVVAALREASSERSRSRSRHCASAWCLLVNRHPRLSHAWTDRPVCMAGGAFHCPCLCVSRWRRVRGRHSQLSVVKPCGKSCGVFASSRWGWLSVPDHFLDQLERQGPDVCTSLFLHGFHHGFDLHRWPASQCEVVKYHPTVFLIMFAHDPHHWPCASLTTSFELSSIKDHVQLTLRDVREHAVSRESEYDSHRLDLRPNSFISCSDFPHAVRF